jgi:hypothetical protein
MRVVVEHKERKCAMPTRPSLAQLGLDTGKKYGATFSTQEAIDAVVRSANDSTP